MCLSPISITTPPMMDGSTCILRYKHTTAVRWDESEHESEKRIQHLLLHQKLLTLLKKLICTQIAHRQSAS